MRGLILKDYYCMRKSLVMIALVSAGIIFLAFMFTLSTKYGNVARMIAEPGAAETENEMMTEEEFYAFYRYVIWIVLFIPMAFMANVTDCFREDKRAGFSKVLFSLPMREYHFAGARYISCLLYGLVGITASCIAAAGVCAASDRLVLTELLSVVFTFAGVMLIFVSLVMPLVYVFGAERADLIQAAVFFAGAAGLFGGCYYFEGDKLAMARATEDESMEAMTGLLNEANRLLTTKGGLVFGIGVEVFCLSFLCAVSIIRTKRGRAI